MTPQEQQLLESLASRIANTQLPQKDADAEALIRDRIGSRPDALYILTQTVLIQEMALNQANQRLHDLQMQQAGQSGSSAPHPTSFLGRLFGTGDAPRYQAPPPPPAAPYMPEPVQYAPSPGGGSSFLRSAAATATGVAAGALAFEGIESLFGHHQGFGGGYGAFGGGGGEFLQGAPSETIINNYYDAPGSEDRSADTRSASDDQDNSVDDSTDVSDADYDTSSDTSADDFSSDSSSDDVNV